MKLTMNYYSPAEKPTTPSSSSKPTSYWKKSLSIISICIGYNLLRMTTQSTEHLELTSVSGFFIQDDLDQEPQPFHVYHPNASFGLIHPHPADRWIQFQEKISHLQHHSPSHVKYKVIFIARHGQGFHNVAESKYGTPLWDCDWSLKTTDGELVWGPDARLTELGKGEARRAETAWTRELADHFPMPEIFIVSPLSRAIETMVITEAWKHAMSHTEKNQTPRPRIIVKEKWRENIGLHTCDQRRSKQEISKDFPLVEFEEGFSEQDLLWTKDVQETDQQLDVRIKAALSDLFLDPMTSDLTYISITAHSGVISSLLRVVGHRRWPIETGGMIPVVVRAAPATAPPSPPPHPGPGATKPPCPPPS